jgi:hypothetical protein
MRRRKTTVITVAGVMTVSEDLADASFAERARQLEAGVAGLPGRRVAAVQCDGCGIAEDTGEHLRLPPGWITDSRGEFCPECQ